MSTEPADLKVVLSVSSQTQCRMKDHIRVQTGRCRASIPSASPRLSIHDSPGCNGRQFVSICVIRSYTDNFKRSEYTIQAYYKISAHVDELEC